MRDSLADAIARLRRRRVGRLVESLVRERLTPAGRAFALLWVLSAVLGASHLEVPIYRLWAFATAALAIAAFAARRALPPLRLVRRSVASTTAGGVAEIEVEVTNPGRRTARDVRVSEDRLPPPLAPDAGSGVAEVARLAPGASTVIRFHVHCPRRGAYTLRGLAAASAWPLGLWRSRLREPQETSFLVYPRFQTPVDFAVPEGRNYQPGGFLLSSSVGESSELMHTREYREGDNPRHLHWPSSARLGRPVVKVFHEEYFVRLALALDTEVRPGVSDAALETAISIAAGIADYLSRREYIIDIFAAGATVYRFQAGRALAHFDHILEILACIDPAPRVDWEALAEAMLPEAARLTGVVAVLTDWTREREALVDRLRSLGVGTRVVVVRDGPTTLPPPTHAPESFLVVPPGAELPAADGGAASARAGVA